MKNGNKKPAPSPNARVDRLDRLCDIRTELSRLYRATRKGQLAPSDATRLGYLLSLLARIIEGSELEKRIEQLERGHAKHQETIGKA